MAIAVQIVDGKPKTYDWMEVLDSDGKRWRFVKKGRAPDGATVHIAIGPPLTLLVADDGKPRLRQDGSGLPKTMWVGFPNPVPQMPGGGVIGGWPDTVYEYELE